MTQPNSLAIDGLKSAFEAIESTRKNLIDAIEIQAPKIHEARTKKQTLLSAPISLTDYSAYLKASISNYAATFESEWLASRKLNGVNHNRVAFSAFEDRAVPLLNGFFGEGFAMSELCFFFPDIVHDRLMSSLRKHRGNPNASSAWSGEDKLDIAARREMLKDLETEIKQLERQQADFQSQLNQINQALSQ